LVANVYPQSLLTERNIYNYWIHTHVPERILRARVQACQLPRAIGSGPETAGCQIGADAWLAAASGLNCALDRLVPVSGQLLALFGNAVPYLLSGAGRREIAAGAN
jgi:hypothetical protein